MNKKIKLPISCEWQKIQENCSAGNITRLYKYTGNFTWKGINTEKYKTPGKDWAGMIRKTLIGNHGETTKFHLRYFEIASGGYSSFEVHRHEHVVIGVRGEGVCIVGKKKYKIGFLDTIYIAPDSPHQLRNPYNEPFGFFCIVNAKRDKPQLIR
jgi:ribulose-bisphosphate carboxylase large chain